MKTQIINQVEDRNIRFPATMQSNGTHMVVLFTNPTTGTVIHVEPGNGNYRSVGEVSDTWTNCQNREVWKPFEGTIKFSNE